MLAAEPLATATLAGSHTLLFDRHGNVVATCPPLPPPARITFDPPVGDDLSRRRRIDPQEFGLEMGAAGLGTGLTSYFVHGPKALLGGDAGWLGIRWLYKHNRLR
jgi:hypothetical protein